MTCPLLLQSCGELLKSFSLTSQFGRRSYCGNHKTYINEADSELEIYFQNLWRLSERPSIFHLQIYTLELLHRLLNMEIRPPKTCGFYTETQVEIAKRAAQILSDDLRQHIPVRQIAERFSVSETSLKNYFRGVYGQNISTWLREIRMNEAARLLSDTKRPIAENPNRSATLIKGNLPPCSKSSLAFLRWNTGGQRIWKIYKSKAGICHLKAKSRPFLCLKTICKSVHLE